MPVYYIDYVTSYLTVNAELSLFLCHASTESINTFYDNAQYYCNTFPVCTSV